MTTTTSTAIAARDFSSSTADAHRDRWTVGKLARVVAALDGDAVAIVCDRQTGFALIGARLVRAYYDGFGPRLLVEVDLSDGTVQQTAYRVADIGSVIYPMANRPGVRGAKWDALDQAALLRAAAIAQVHAQWEAEGCTHGVWSADIDGSKGGHSAYVRYVPADNPPAGTSTGERRGQWVHVPTIPTSYAELYV
jgi:hypothetical protein